MAEEEQTTTTNDVRDLKDKLDGFRDNNIKLANQIKEYETGFVDMRKELDALKEAKGEAEEKAKGKETLEDRLLNLEESNRLKDEEIAKERGVNKTNRIKSMLVKAMTDKGAEVDAANDAAMLSLSHWDVNEAGELEYSQNGKTVYSQENPGDNLNPAEWATLLRESKPHFFPTAKGDGASNRGDITVNGKPAIDANDPVALGLYADQVASGKMVTFDSGGDVQINQVTMVE